MELSDDDTEENEDSVGTKEEGEGEAEEEGRCKGASVQVGVCALIGALWVKLSHTAGILLYSWVVILRKRHTYCKL